MPQTKKRASEPRKTRMRTVQGIRRRIGALETEIRQIQSECRHEYYFVRWESPPLVIERSKYEPPRTLIVGTVLLGSECSGIYEKRYAFAARCEKCEHETRTYVLSRCPKCHGRIVRKRRVRTERYFARPKGLEGFEVILHGCDNPECRFKGVTIERDPKHVDDPDEPF